MYIKIKLNEDLRGYKKGSVIKIKVSDNNVPKDIYWRRRLEDSMFDNCIEIVYDKKKVIDGPAKSEAPHKVVKKKVKKKVKKEVKNN